MSRHRLYVYGAGGHGKVVAEAIRLHDAFEIVAFVDDSPHKVGKVVDGIPTVGTIEVPAGSYIALAIGMNRMRQEAGQRALSQGFQLITVVHPSAVIARGAKVGEGTYIGPLSVVHSDARVGRGCIVNSGAVVEHDCTVGDWVHVSPHSTLGGHVGVDEGSHIGMSATVLPNLEIGKWSIVGAGAVVISSIGDGVTAVGVPAKIIGPARTNQG